METPARQRSSQHDSVDTQFETALLERFMSAPTDIEADAHLGRLLEEFARPLIRKVVARKGRELASGADGEDLVAETLAQLVKRFRALRIPGSPAIADLRAYVATAAHRRCDERLRRSHPVRARLAKQIRYLFGRREDLILWRDASGRKVCASRGDGVANGGDRVMRGSRTRELATIENLVYDALARAGGAVSFEALINDVARAAGEVREPLEIPLERAVVATSGSHFDQRLSLRDLWRDLAHLPRRQCAALMLNLRDPAAREPVSLAPLVEIAGFAAIAARLDLTPAELAPIWGDAPLDDERIAALLGVTRPQVVKLRRLARERLWRRRRSS